MIITLCGSARFEDLFRIWDERLTLYGHVVFNLSVMPSSKGGVKNWYTDEIKQTLDLAHLHKIDLSDAILVLNEDQYIGESTAREVEWAERKGKVIYALDDSQCATFLPAEALINGMSQKIFEASEQSQ